MKHKTLGILVLALALVFALSACGGNDKNAAENSTVSPSPSAETNVFPSAEPTPGSVNENNTNTGDVTKPENSVAPGDNNMGSANEGTNGGSQNNGSSNEPANGKTEDSGSAHSSTNESGSANESGSVSENSSAGENGRSRSGAANNGSDRQDSTMGEDLKRAGEDMGNAVRDAAQGVENGINNMGR